MSASGDDHPGDDQPRDDDPGEDSGHRNGSGDLPATFDVRAALLGGTDLVLGDDDEVVFDQVVSDEAFDDEVVEAHDTEARPGATNGRRRDRVPPTGALPGRRHEARERALHLLYEAEVKGVPVTAVLDALPLAPDPFAVELLEGLDAHGAEIDVLVAGHSHRWHLDRMPALDRAVLRLGAYELAHRPDVPTAVVIDEAVELAKQYSTDRSGGFVNGVLSAIAADVRRA